MLWLTPGHLKTKKMLPFIIKYVPDQYKTKEICDKVIGNGGMLGFIPDYYKNQKMCDKALNNYSHALRFVADCFNTEKMCNKVAGAYTSAIQVVPDWYKTQEMCDKAIDTCPFVCCMFFMFILVLISTYDSRNMW